MGAIVSSAAAQQNAAMFSTSTTIKQGFNTLDVADKARAAQAAQDSAQSTLQQQYGMPMGPMGPMGYPGYGMYGAYGGYGMFGGGFNSLIFAISYVALGLFAIAFLVTFFVAMSEELRFGLGAVFLFFFSHHIMYLLVQTWNQGGFMTFTEGFVVFFGALTIGIGGGALWAYHLHEMLKGTRAGNITIGVVAAIAFLLVMVAMSHRFAMGTSVGYAARASMLQAGASRAQIVPGANQLM